MQLLCTKEIFILLSITLLFLYYPFIKYNFPIRINQLYILHDHEPPPGKFIQTLFYIKEFIILLILILSTEIVRNWSEWFNVLNSSNSFLISSFSLFCSQGKPLNPLFFYHGALFFLKNCHLFLHCFISLHPLFMYELFSIQFAYFLCTFFSNFI